jgi:hypothetical protein
MKERVSRLQEATSNQPESRSGSRRIRGMMKVIALAGLLALLVVPAAQADPARRQHDYLATSSAIHPVAQDVRDHQLIHGYLATSSAIHPVAQDVRDHQLILRYLAAGSESGNAASRPFGWGDFGIGIGTGVGTMLILVGLVTATLTRRRRRVSGVPTAVA